MAVFVLISLRQDCLDNNITGTKPLTLTLTAELVGDPIQFGYGATGTGLTAIDVTYGDGETG
ncbi:MAG: hypothetical protein MK237_03405 [Gemmatimonadetes bacterium]|nr:hypothetical protein [Gemmatimonadota bacterium]